MANRYWVGGAGTWDASSTTHWSTSSGGASGASVPTSADSVFFDQAGTYTVTLGTSANLYLLNWTVSAGTVTFVGTPYGLYLYGSISLIAGTVCTFTTSNMILYGAAKTIQTNGTTFPNTGFNIRTPSATNSTTTLLDALTCTTMIIAVNGSTHTFVLNGYTVTLTSSTSSALVINSSVTINFGTGGSFVFSNGGGVTASSSTGSITTSGTGTLQFNGSSNFIVLKNRIFPGVTVSKGGTGSINIYDSNTFDTIQNTAQPVTFNFLAGTVTTVTNFNINGTSGNLVTLKSAIAGSQFTISKPSGTVTANYLSIKDSAATGGAVWIADFSTDAGNNSGWIINAGGSQFVSVNNTGLDMTGAVGDVTIASDQTILPNNIGILGYCFRPNALSYSIFIGTAGTVGPLGVAGTGRIGLYDLRYDNNFTVTGVSGTGVVSNTPLNIWISVNTNQTADWTPIAT
jgi:hypothetical protein